MVVKCPECLGDGFDCAPIIERNRDIGFIRFAVSKVRCMSCREELSVIIDNGIATAVKYGEPLHEYCEYGKASNE